MEKKKKRVLMAVGIGGSFATFFTLIVYLARSELVTVAMAKLI